PVAKAGARSARHPVGDPRIRLGRQRPARRGALDPDLLARPCLRPQRFRRGDRPQRDRRTQERRRARAPPPRRRAGPGARQSRGLRRRGALSGRAGGDRRHRRRLRRDRPGLRQVRRRRGGVSMAETLGYGAWRSPITSDLIVAGALGLSRIAADGDDIYWVESRPAEGGRNVLVRRGRDGGTADVTPPPYNVRTRVHEYGGG